MNERRLVSCKSGVQQPERRRRLVSGGGCLRSRVGLDATQQQEYRDDDVGRRSMTVRSKDGVGCGMQTTVVDDRAERLVILVFMRPLLSSVISLFESDSVSHIFNDFFYAGRNDNLYFFRQHFVFHVMRI